MSKIVYPKVALSTLADGNRYYDLGNSPQLTNMRAMTIWAWIWVDAVGFTFGRIFSCGDNTNELCIDGGVGLDEAKVFFEMVRSPSNARAHSAVDIPIGQWYFVSATWALDEIPIIYQGGIGEQIVEPATYTTQSAGSGTPADNSANNKWLLSRPTGANNRNLDGAVASVGIINRVLSREELQTIKDRPRVVHGQLAYWIAGQDGTLNRITDYSKYGFHGSLNGTDALTSVRSVPIPHELPLKSRFALADPLPDTRLLKVEQKGSDKDKHGYSIDFGKVRRSGMFANSDSTLFEYTDLATFANWNPNAGFTCKDIGLTLDGDNTLGRPVIGLNPNLLGPFGPHQFSECIVRYVDSTYVLNAYMGPAIFIAGDEADGTQSTLDAQYYAIFTEKVANNGVGEYTLYKSNNAGNNWDALVGPVQGPDAYDRPVHLRLEGLDDGTQTILDWWIDGVKQTQYIDSHATARIVYTCTLSGIFSSFPGLGWGGNGGGDTFRRVMWMRAGNLPEKAETEAFYVPIEYEELTFDEDKEERLFMIPPCKGQQPR